MSVIPDEAVRADGSIDIALLSPDDRVRVRLANDLMATQALSRMVADPAQVRKHYLESSGLGPKAIDIVLALFAHPEIVEDVLAFVLAKVGETNEPGVTAEN